MRRGRSFLATAVLVSLCASACEEEGGGEVDLVGTWLRTRSIQIGRPDTGRKEQDTWELTLREDGTFVELHKWTSDLENNPLQAQESRQGTYGVESGDLVLEGDWLELRSGDVESLGDLGDQIYTFTRRTKMIVSDDGNILFFGTDLDHFQNSWVYPYPSSYLVMHFDESTSTLWREFSGELLDRDGNVLERRQERFEFQILGNDECQGQYSRTFVETNMAGEETKNESVSGPFTSCTYSISSNTEVENVDGAMIPVMAMDFQYEADDLTYTVTPHEYYIRVGQHYLGYHTSERETALRNSAYVRIR